MEQDLYRYKYRSMNILTRCIHQNRLTPELFDLLGISTHFATTKSSVQLQQTCACSNRFLYNIILCIYIYIYFIFITLFLYSFQQLVTFYRNFSSLCVLCIKLEFFNIDSISEYIILFIESE